MVLDDEKLILAFSGAAIALVLKAVYDWIAEKIRRKRIRDLILTDLKQHDRILKRLIERLENVVYDKNKDMQDVLGLIDAIPSIKLNTAVFDSVSYIDYHKAYTETQFDQLTTIYFGLKTYYEFNPVISIQEALKHTNGFEGSEQEKAEKLKTFNDSSGRTIGLYVTRIYADKKQNS